jgi:SAM-dependent methyltransferase
MMEQEDAQLYEMDPVGRFSDRATDYVKYRPTYPPAAIDAILDGLPTPSSLIVADVGAGTGISARLLARRGARVLAVEPNAAMRQSSEPHPLVEWREATAEATGLDDASVDLVLCAQAFHWFRQEDALREFHRVLRPGGRLALLWNSRDRNDPLTLAFIVAIHAVNGEHPAERRELDTTLIHRGRLFTPARLLMFAQEQELDRSGLIGRATSASYVPREGDRFETLRRSLEHIHDRYRDANGRVRMRYVTKLYLADRL